MQSLSRDKGQQFIWTVIDMFSKRAWAIPIKNKWGKEMVAAFQKIFKDAHPGKPARLETDARTEFLIRDLHGFLKREGLHHFV